MRRKIIRRTRRRGPAQEKSLLVAYLLMLIPPLGFFGVHKFYTGRILQGLVFMALVYDFFTLPAQINNSNGLLGAGANPGLLEYEEETFSDDPSYYGNMQVSQSEIDAVRQSVRRERKAAPRNIEKEIIELAEQKDLNQLTLKDVIKAGYSLDEAKVALDRFENEGLCEIVVMDGVKIYCFPS
jgi:hypothetical protein